MISNFFRGQFRLLPAWVTEHYDAIPSAVGISLEIMLLKRYPMDDLPVYYLQLV